MQVAISFGGSLPLYIFLCFLNNRFDDATFPFPKLCLSHREDPALIRVLVAAGL